MIVETWCENAGQSPSGSRMVDSFPIISRWPPIIYTGAVRLPSGLDPAAVFERLSDRHGWGSSWRDSIYDYAHYHSSIHEVLGIARGSGRVRAPSQGAGGVAAIGNTERYVSIRQRAKNSRRIPTGMAELEAVLAALRKKCQEGISRPASAAKSGGN
jgi:hypothetical protein